MSQPPGPGEGRNPWLDIPAGDYEGHMASSPVGQLQMLNQLFQRVLAETLPESVAVLGCTTGNGFEHFDPSVTLSILGVDINPAYLEAARLRYGGEWGPRMELKCADLHTDCFGRRQFDLVHAALVFEYVEAPIVLAHIYRALKPHGKLAVVLQMPTPGLPAVSRTPYTSLEKLAPVMHLFERAQFDDLARRSGFTPVSGELITLPSGKEFLFGIYHTR
jgi:ubiquinone/menaquinone biosynthesis C-methylase UbiE